MAHHKNRANFACGKESYGFEHIGDALQKTTSRSTYGQQREVVDIPSVER